MDIFNFIGRLHPLIVHLPIGFLFLAILLEWAMGKSSSTANKRIVMFILVLGAVSAMVAIGCGWLLALDGEYESSILSWHRWLGKAIGILAILAPITKYFSKTKLYRLTLVLIGLLLMGTGHYGGSLTHGSDYLLQPLKGEASNANNQVLAGQNPDSIVVYNTFIQPIFERKCYDCHNAEKDMGGLDMTSYKSLIEGGDHGKVIKKKAWSSELALRVTLPKTNIKYMPPKGIPLDFNEITLLKWWIDRGGADSSKTVMELNPDDTIKHILDLNYSIDTSPKTLIERLKINPVDSIILKSLVQSGWKINQIAEGNNLLDVSYVNKSDFSNKDLALLEKIKDHITWLNLSGMSLTDSDIKILSQCKYLTRLQLDNNAISGDGLAELSKLKHLESLNLNNNPLNFEIIDWAEPMTSLKRMYLWQTNIDKDVPIAFISNYPMYN